MKRRAAVEPVIGHLKADHRMNRNDLKGQDGDRINAVLAAAGFNFHLLLRRLAALLRAIFPAALQSNRSSALTQPDSSPREELHGRLAARSNRVHPLAVPLSVRTDQQLI